MIGKDEEVKESGWGYGKGAEKGCGRRDKGYLVVLVD